MLHFTVPGEPKGKGRPRSSVIPAKGDVKARARLYTPSETVSYENRIALAAHKALQGRDPYAEAVEVSIRVRLVPANSASKKKRTAMLAGEIGCTRKPDADNVCKAVLDGLNKVAFSDDVLVTKLLVEKVWAAFPGVDVLIRPCARRAA